MDQAGVICKQEGIFRINCMDCLDRTNVVQAAIARVVMEQQVRCFFFSKNVNYRVYLLLLCTNNRDMNLHVANEKENHIYNIELKSILNKLY